MDELWGPETRKAVENFPVSGEPMPVSVIHWLAQLKAAAAATNAELGLIDGDRAERIRSAALRVAAGEFDEQFPVDVFQTGSGTSTNMNANEVIATLAGPDVHPNDHVNLGQSSNDTVPTAVHLAAISATRDSVIPALELLRDALDRKAAEFDLVPKAGRTHLMDAVPITLGQEFSGYAAQIAADIDRLAATLPRVAQVPLGGTAVGTGLNAHPDFATSVRERVETQTGVRIVAPANRFEAQASRDSLVELSGALKVVAVSYTKIANDLVVMGSGPLTGFGEITLPELQKGSSIMPGKVNPVIPEMVLQVAAQVVGNDVAITIAGSQGNFELNARVPLIARNLLHSLRLTAAAARLLAERCVDGIVPNIDRLEWNAQHTLASATALNPVLGYDEVTEIVRLAQRSGRSLREIVRERGLGDDVEAVLDPLQLARHDTGFAETMDDQPG